MIFEMGNSKALEKIGGKAFQLAELSEAGFLVPSFLVLTGEAFYEFLGEERERLYSLLSVYKDERLVLVRNAYWLYVPVLWMRMGRIVRLQE